MKQEYVNEERSRSNLSQHCMLLYYNDFLSLVTVFAHNEFNVIVNLIRLLPLSFQFSVAR